MKCFLGLHKWFTSAENDGYDVQRCARGMCKAVRTVLNDDFDEGVRPVNNTLNDVA